MKHGDTLSPLLFNFVSHYATMKVEENQGELEFSGTRPLLINANDINYWEERAFYREARTPRKQSRAYLLAIFQDL
jgi:hypothetical protein